MTTHSNEYDSDGERLTRRGSLLRLAGIAAAAGGGAAWRLDSAYAAGSGPLAVDGLLARIRHNREIKAPKAG